MFLDENPFGRVNGYWKGDWREAGQEIKVSGAATLGRVTAANWQRHSQQPRLLQEFSSIIFTLQGSGVWLPVHRRHRYLTRLPMCELLDPPSPSLKPLNASLHFVCSQSFTIPFDREEIRG